MITKINIKYINISTIITYTFDPINNLYLSYNGYERDLMTYTLIQYSGHFYALKVTNYSRYFNYNVIFTKESTLFFFMNYVFEKLLT